MRNALGGHDSAFHLAQLGGRVRGHDDIGVVREDDHLVGICLFDGFEQIGCRGVHGLTARNNDIDAEALQDLRDPLARCDCYDAERLAHCPGGLLF